MEVRAALADAKSQAHHGVLVDAGQARGGADAVALAEGGDDAHARLEGEDVRHGEALPISGVWAILALAGLGRATARIWNPVRVSRSPGVRFVVGNKHSNECLRLQAYPCVDRTLRVLALAASRLTIEPSLSVVATDRGVLKCATGRSSRVAAREFSAYPYEAAKSHARAAMPSGSACANETGQGSPHAAATSSGLNRAQPRSCATATM